MTKTVNGQGLIAMGEQQKAGQVQLFGMKHKPNGQYEVDFKNLSDRDSVVKPKGSTLAVSPQAGQRSIAIIETPYPTPISPQSFIEHPNPQEPLPVNPTEPMPPESQQIAQVACQSCGQLLNMGEVCNICERLENDRIGARQNRRDWALRKRFGKGNL